MLSWKDEEDALATRSRPGSLSKPIGGFARSTGSSFESSRVGSLPRSSLDRAGPLSPPSGSGSVPKATSLLHGPGHAADGTIGSEGWWHHMDAKNLNEPPSEAKDDKPVAFMPQFNVTGTRQSLWADEEPAVSTLPAPIAAAAAPAAPASTPIPVPAVAAVLAECAASVASPPRSEGGAECATGKDGWWTRMDAGALNQLAESAPHAAGTVVKGERVMGGGFVPQFGVAGGNAYKSIFEEGDEAEAKESQAPKPLEEQVLEWAPFTAAAMASTSGLDGGAAPTTCAVAVATAGADDDGWSSFTSAPKVA